MMSNQIISIIPLFCLIETHLILFTQVRYFLLCKSKIFCHITRICHGILSKHVKCRMGSIFFYRQNSCPISQSNIILVLKPRAKKIQIFFLRILILLILPEKAVPLIDQNHKRTLCFRIDIFHHLNQIIFIPEPNISKMFHKIKHQVFLQHGQHIIHAVGHAEKLLHIDFDDIILVQMNMVRSCPADF